MQNNWIQHIPCNPNLRGLADHIPDIIFSDAAGVTLKMQLLRPWEGKLGKKRFPLIVFLQGSGWTSPDVYYELPQLAQYARSGYVAASITHRSYLDGHPAPAFLQDAKTAVRFLRAHAGEYSIDPERICFFGTSSGGNTAMLMALTGDDPRYRTEEYPSESDAVQLAVACFGPTDLLELLGHIDGKDDEIRKFVGGRIPEHHDLLREMSPIHILDPSKPYPPLLIIHGSEDPVVPYEQGERMYHALLAAGKDAEMICIDGAPHEGSFWSSRLHDTILDFIQRRL